MSDKPLVRYDVEDSIGVITVDNPPVNALSPGVPEGIADWVRQAAEDAEVRAIVRARFDECIGCDKCAQACSRDAWNAVGGEPLVGDPEVGPHAQVAFARGRLVVVVGEHGLHQPAAVGPGQC